MPDLRSDKPTRTRFAHGATRNPASTKTYENHSAKLRVTENEPLQTRIRLTIPKTEIRVREGRATGLRLKKGNNKMKRVVRRTFALLALVTMALGADNTLGAWKYNVAKSKAARGVSPITNLTVTREPADGGVKITAKGERADGTKIDTVTTVKYDDKQVSVTGTGLTWDMTAIEQVNGKTLTEERWKTGGK